MNAPISTGRVIIIIIRKIMKVRIINRMSCSNFNFRIESFSKFFKKRKELKFMVIIFLRFNKWMISGMAVNGSNHRKNGVKKLSEYLLELEQ